MRIESERGLIRPGHQFLGVEMTGSGVVAAVIEHEGTTMRVYFDVVEAERIGCGLIGAATLEKALHRKPVLDGDGREVTPLERLCPCPGERVAG